MHLVVLADNDKQKAEFLSKNKNKNVFIDFVHHHFELLSYKNADALFILQDKINIRELRLITTQPVFIHSVTVTLNDAHLSKNISRINAWPTFLKRELWEVATKDEATVKGLFNSLGWNFLVTPDEPGFIAARIIAMIINEAYYAFEECVSTKEEIDISMRLGTNYPYGPFEWAQIIGVHNIYHLLQRLEKDSKRYTASSALEAEVKNSNK